MRKLGRKKWDGDLMDVSPFIMDNSIQMEEGIIAEFLCWYFRFHLKSKKELQWFLDEAGFDLKSLLPYAPSREINRFLDRHQNPVVLKETDMLSKTVGSIRYLEVTCPSTGCTYRLFPPDQSTYGAYYAWCSLFGSELISYRQGDVGFVGVKKNRQPHWENERGMDLPMDET
ncbi:hypothetical protein [Thermoflavifilum thermophilum]|uniref:Uncharacterized protein n=1 Tax=Thermoflavifilum thermophilum TaxID=1393122 RepID=A0A1I7MXE8_9BACT|nr:hypothetical protein [Thermoflavifilum thermophilum]SFV27097.1 hypothetical protein SAMN05660895_0036 [Thermoflavifilum thermophilum]